MQSAENAIPSKIEVTSLGTVGEPDYNRSEGRAYWTRSEIITCFTELQRSFLQFKMESERRGRRRCVLRAVVTPEVAQQCIKSLPVEVCVPLATIGLSDNYLILIAENTHKNIAESIDIPTINGGTSKTRTPLERIQNLNPAFALSNTLTEVDTATLLELWKPFGWTMQGVQGIIASLSTNKPETIWFSGVRQVSDGKLVSACMGESITIGNLQLVEGTEYSTLPGYEGHGLCTAAVAGLHAQVLADLLYEQGVVPLITSEYNLSSKSYFVGKHVGVKLPEIDNSIGEVTQVLRHNVSVLDHQPPHDIYWHTLPEREKVRDAFRTKYRYWRNFVMGILDLESIKRLYSQEDVRGMLATYKG